jgi:hypothetical protein
VQTEREGISVEVRELILLPTHHGWRPRDVSSIKTSFEFTLVLSNSWIQTEISGFCTLKTCNLVRNTETAERVHLNNLFWTFNFDSVEGIGQCPFSSVSLVKEIVEDIIGSFYLRGWRHDGTLIFSGQVTDFRFPMTTWDRFITPCKFARTPSMHEKIINTLNSTLSNLIFICTRNNIMMAKSTANLHLIRLILPFTSRKKPLSKTPMELRFLLLVPVFLERDIRGKNSCWSHSSTTTRQHGCLCLCHYTQPHNRVWGPTCFRKVVLPDCGYKITRHSDMKFVSTDNLHISSMGISSCDEFSLLSEDYTRCMSVRRPRFLWNYFLRSVGAAEWVR